MVCLDRDLAPVPDLLDAWGPVRQSPPRRENDLHRVSPRYSHAARHELGPAHAEPLRAVRPADNAQKQVVERPP